MTQNHKWRKQAWFQDSPHSPSCITLWNWACMDGCQGGTLLRGRYFYWLLPVLYKQPGLSWMKLACWLPPQLDTGISGSLGLCSHPLRQSHSNLKIGEKADVKQKSDYWLLHHLLDNVKHKTLARAHGRARSQCG